MQNSISTRERKRLQKLSLNEERLRSEGYSRIAGTDEVGRGPLAGPVVAAACMLPHGYLLEHLNDSKKITPQLRFSLYEQLITDPNVVYGIGIVAVERIDEINIFRASMEAMRIAIDCLKVQPDYLLVDGSHLPGIDLPAEALIGGDRISISIAAASVIAKVTRDRIMVEQALQWPQYAFEQNKGYATLEHLEALHRFGYCPIHRKSFEPIKSMLKNKEDQKAPSLQQLDLFT